MEKNEEIVSILQTMLDRYNRKREQHKRTHSSYKNRDIKIFGIPLMVVQFINAILPQISQLHEHIEDIINVIMSSLAAISAIWLGFQAKKRYGELSESHKNAASIYQHLAVLTMVEKKRAKMMIEYDKEKFFQFRDMALNLEGKAKDDEYLIPDRIVREISKEKKDKEKHELKKNTLKGKPEEEFDINIPALPAITDGKVSWP